MFFLQVFTHFEPFMAVIDIDCWMAMATSWNSERQSEKHFVPADVCIIRHVEESLCSVSPNTPSTFGAGWSWGFKSQSEQSQVFVYLYCLLHTKTFCYILFHLRFFCFDCLDPRSLIHFGAIMISRYCRQGFECFWRWGHFSGMWPQSGANGNLLTMTINENLACNDIYQDLSYIHVRHVAVVNPSCPGGQANERWLCPSSRRDGQFGTNTSCDQM